MKSLTYTSRIILIMLFILSVAPLYSQPIPPAPNAPVSGGIGILLSATIIYTLIKKFKKGK